MTDDTADPTTEETDRDASDAESDPTDRSEAEAGVDEPTGGNATDDRSADGDTSGEPSTEDGSSGPNADRIVYYTQLAAFAVLALLALVATFRFYFAASNAISVWISSRFVSAFQAAFNLVVVIASVIGLSLLVRRMRSG